MSNGETTNVFDRLFKLLAKICMMIVDGTRKAEEVAECFQVILSKENFFSILMFPRSASVNTDTPADGWAAEWQRFLKDTFGIVTDLSGVQIPDDPGGFGWVAFVIKELTYNRVYAKCRELFACSSEYGDDLDSVILWEKEERTADNGPYAVRFRNRVEPDEENKNLSANTLAERQTTNITLRESMLMKLWYRWRTGGGHMNFENWEMCPGSRYRDGSVPCVRRCRDKFRVDSCDPDGAYGGLASRSAVRLPLNPSVL